MTKLKFLLLPVGVGLFILSGPNGTQALEPGLKAENNTDLFGQSSKTLKQFIRDDGGISMSMNIKSPVFEHNGDIPAHYTCEGDDISPPLSWSGVPQGTKSLALIADDPDAPDPAAPKMTWVHWILYNIPPETHELPEAVTTSVLPDGTRQGLNDWKKTGYGGPCPPIGRHRYFFKLYALDTTLPDLGKPTKPELEKAIQDHVIDKAELIGTYEKHR